MPTPEQPTPDQTKELWERFEKSREMALWAQFIDAVKKSSHDTDPYVTLPTGFIRIAAVDLQATPFTWPVMRKVWNGLVDEMGLPEVMKRSFHED